jgi:hypothetical protein
MAILNLKHPLTIGKTTIDKLTFREHTTAGDYLSFDKRGPVAQRHALIASLTGTEPELIGQLHGVDYRRAEAMADAMIEADEKEFFADTGAEPEKKSSAS